MGILADILGDVVAQIVVELVLLPFKLVGKAISAAFEWPYHDESDEG